MNGNSREKQPAVRPGFLILALIVLGAALYWNFFMNPKPQPDAAQPPAPALTPPDNNLNTGSQPETQATKISPGPVSQRDLFLPPPLVIAARRVRGNDINRPSQPVWNEPPGLMAANREIAMPAKSDENPEKPVLKGIIGTASAQVIIVRYQNKSYLLKPGDILPGTEYRVAEVNSDAVILISPKGRLKLDKKVRATHG